MQYTFSDNNTGQFHSFSAIADATLRMTYRLLNISERGDQVDEILELMKHLPIKDDVQEGLSALSDYGYRIGALTNSSNKIVAERMEPTGLVSYFEEILSADQFGKYKPATELYTWAANKFNLQPADILMVTSQGWDLAGAANAGMRTAYLQQSKQLLYPLAPSPDLTCKTVIDLANQLHSSFN